MTDGLWVYLAASPLLWLTCTLLIWIFAAFVAGLMPNNPLVNPTLMSITVIAVILYVTGRNLLPMIVALAIGSLTAVGSTILLSETFGFPEFITASLAPKSTTAEVAMAISKSLAGDPSLTAAVVVLTGICGAIVVTPMMNAMGVRDYGARGFAVGLASHGIGTARAYSVNPVAGLFSGIAMGLNAIVTSIVVHLFL
jgi:putative effector of murein hydrolase